MTEWAIILAAGASRRLGRPKQLVLYDGVPLIVHAVRTAEAASLEPLVVVGADADEITEVLPGRVRLVRNSRWRDGMGTSVASGVSRVRELGAERVVIMTCDQLRVEADDLRRLCDACQGVDAAAASYEGVVGVPACFAQRSFDRLVDLEADEGARELLRVGELDVRSVSMPRAAFDIDHPDDLDHL